MYKRQAAYLLHNESFSAEQAGTKLLIKEYGQFDSHLSCQERALLKNHLLPRSNLECTDRSWKTGRKRNHSRPSLRSIDILEHMLTGKHPPKRLADAAIGGGLHQHVGGHPCHASAFGDQDVYKRQPVPGPALEAGSS